MSDRIKHDGNSGDCFDYFFSTIGPLDVAAVFAALTSSATPAERRSYAVRGILIASIILGVFALTGDFLLASFGISLAALRTAGGVLLLLSSASGSNRNPCHHADIRHFADVVSRSVYF